MSVINAPTLQDVAYSGEAPLAAVHGSANLVAAQVGDKIRLSKVYAGTKVYDAKIVHGALGTGVTVDLGFEYCNGESGSNATAFLSADAEAAAGKSSSSVAPVTLAYDAYIVATIGGAAATGKIDSVLTYEFKGK